jgi:hypothetical protein
LARSRIAWTSSAACVLGALAAAAPYTAPDTAGRRLRGEASAIGRRVREPGRTHNSGVGRLDERAFRERASEVARELSGDLRDPTLTARDKDDALAGLREIGPLAAVVAPVLVAVLHDHDRDESPNARVAFFCAVTRAMETVAPRDPAVIEALAGALDREPAGGGTCHRCACALEALIASGPAAKEIAGPALARLARGPSRVEHNRLEQAIEAVGAGSAMMPTLLARATRPGVSIDDRAASLRALAKSFGQLSPDDQEAVRVNVEPYLFDRYVEIRVASAELLGLTGPRALSSLMRALDDPRYEPRAAAARALARLGPAAAPARSALIAGLDPFLGTGEAAAEALVAMGPVAHPDVDAAARSAPRHLRPLVEATASAVASGDMAPVRAALARAYTRLQPSGYADVEVLQPGPGKAYAANAFRIRARIRGGVYTPGGPPAPAVDETLIVDGAPNALFAALNGRHEGDRLRVRLSPETVPDPYFRFPTPRPASVAQFPVGSGADFEVEIQEVCEPVIWTIFKGGGIVGPIRFESHCR